MSRRKFNAAKAADLILHDLCQGRPEEGIRLVDESIRHLEATGKLSAVAKQQTAALRAELERRL